jgi:pimeloyl-ACP methyl ester carboxylesterase
VLAALIVALTSVSGVQAAECDSAIVFIGLRGSDEPGDVEERDFTLDASHMGETVVRVYEAFAKQLTGQPVAIGYDAVPVAAALADGTYDTSRDAGAISLTRKLHQLMNCNHPPRMVLAGYSQGADAIKKALRDYPDPIGLYPRVAAIILVSDPSWSGSEHNYRIGDGNPSRNGARGPANTPDALLNRTLAVCRNGDPICNSPGTNSDSYSSSGWLDASGEWAARVVIGVAVIPNLVDQVVQDEETGRSWLVRTDGRWSIPEEIDYQCWTNDHGLPANILTTATLNRQVEAWGRQATCSDTAAGTTTVVPTSLTFVVDPSTCGSEVCRNEGSAMRGVMSGFTPNSTVRIWVYTPDGRDGNNVSSDYSYVTTAATDGLGNFAWKYWWNAGMTTGTYETTIRDGSTLRSVTAEFTFIRSVVSGTTTTTKPPVSTSTTRPTSTTTTRPVTTTTFVPTTTTITQPPTTTTTLPPPSP